jgi:outer membrane protein OmpA-like peptidoglycan-associated protein
MRRKMVLLLACSAVLIQSAAITIARAEIPGLPTFSQSSTGIYFDGLATSSIKVSKNPEFEVGCNDFTIAWWQKAPTIQNLYPRLFQFGTGQHNGDGFAVSQEGGNLYFWFNNSTNRSGIPSLLNVPLPNTPDQWNHFAIVRKSSSVAIYINGVSTIYPIYPIDSGFRGVAEAGPAGVCPTGVPPHTMGTPSDIDSLDLLIGGSDDDRLGGFKGEVTGFEFLKGARWTGDFTPPTTYTTDSCQRRDTSNNCTLESLLLLYPTEDFTTSRLNNLITGAEVLRNDAVTYGQQGTTPTPTPTPTPTDERYEVELLYGEGGYICIPRFDGVEVCNAGGNQTVSIRNDLTPYISIFPSPGQEIESVSITPSGAQTVTSEELYSGIVVPDSDETEFTFIRTFSDSIDVYVVPAGFSEFQILVTFRNIKYSYVDLLETNFGAACLYDIEDDEICSDDTEPYAYIRSNDPDGFSINPDPRYEFESVTITPFHWDVVDNPVDGVAGSSTSDSIEFEVTDHTGKKFIFDWLSGDLLIPEDIGDFRILVTFKRSPTPPLASPSIENTTCGEEEGCENKAWHFSDYESYQILSIDENAPNDYSDVQSILLEVAYFPNDPLNPDAPSPKSFCRGYIDDWDTVNIFYDPPNDITTDGIEFWLPQTYDDFFENCRGYHQTGELTAARIYLFAYQEVPAEDIETLNISTAMQFVSLNIFSSPGIENIFTGSEVSINEEVIFEASNINEIRGFDLKFYSNIDFLDGYCNYYINIIDVYGEILPQFLNEDGNITFNMPSYAEINSSCGGANEHWYEYYDDLQVGFNYFNEGVEAIDSTSDYKLVIQVYDKYADLYYWEGEKGTELTFKATQSSKNTNDSDSNSSPKTQAVPTPKPQPAPTPKRKVICPTSTTLIVNFSGGSSEIKTNGNAQITRIVKLIKTCKYNNIKLTGHTSVYVPVTPSYKLFSEYLSRTRANAVKSAIAGKITTKKNNLNYLISDKSEQKAIKFQNSGKTRLSSRRVEVSLNF